MVGGGEDAAEFTVVFARGGEQFTEERQHGVEKGAGLVEAEGVLWEGQFEDKGAQEAGEKGNIGSELKV